MNHSEDWEKRKKELLDEYHTMQEMKEEKQKKMMLNQKKIFSMKNFKKS